MDKIARLRQEIERRLNILTNVYAEQVERKDEEMMNYYHGKVIALEELLSFLNTLSEEPDKSLEEEIKKEMVKLPFFIRGKDQIAFARHFAEWGAEHLRDSTKMIDKSLEEAAYKYSFDSRPSIYGQVDVIDAFKAGAKWKKDALLEWANEQIKVAKANNLAYSPFEKLINKLNEM